MSKNQHGHSRAESVGWCCAWLALASLGLGDRASAENQDRWRRNPNVGSLESVTLRIHWFESTADLRKAAETSGQAINERGLSGFSILRRNTETGEYVCDLYVVKITGTYLDGARTTTFGHEVLHCFGLQHELQENPPGRAATPLYRP